MVKTQRYYCLLDIGGSKILSLLVKGNGSVVYREKVPTRETEDFNQVIEQINMSIERSAKNLPRNAELWGIGICIAAFVNFHEGKLYGAPNLPFKRNIPLRDILYKTWKKPVVIENDANAAVLGEATYGAAKGLNNVIYITVSTGIGGGLYLGGELYRGKDGFAGEIGHIKIDGNENLCGCGMYGCLESISSGKAIENEGKKKLQNDNLNTASIFAEARRGNEIAVDIINESVSKLGAALANLVTLLNPDAIVIGGGVSQEGELLFTKLKNYMSKNLSVPQNRQTKLLKSKLDPESGIWGTFLLLDKAGGQSN